MKQDDVKLNGLDILIKTWAQVLQYVLWQGLAIQGTSISHM